MNDTIPATGHLLGAADIRRIAADAGISPTKKFGQNFVIDPGTVRRIVREAGVTAADHVMEVGPGLGSLTLAILETGATMTAVEIDPPLAERLPGTVAEFMPEATCLISAMTHRLRWSPICRTTWPRRFCSRCWSVSTTSARSW